MFGDGFQIYISDIKIISTNGNAVPVDGNDGLMSLQIGLAAIKSLKEKRPVKIAEINLT